MHDGVEVVRGTSETVHLLVCPRYEVVLACNVWVGTELLFGITIPIRLSPGLGPAEDVDSVELEPVVAVETLVFVVETDWHMVSWCVVAKSRLCI
jgi:hypothetical protein